MDEDKSFEELFYSFGIAASVCAIMVPLVKCFTEYYFCLILIILCIMSLGLIIYQRHIYKTHRSRQLITEEKELKDLIQSIDQPQQQGNGEPRRRGTATFYSPPCTPVPIRKIGRVVKRAGSVTY